MAETETGAVSGRAIPKILRCPDCGDQHIDHGEWATTRFHRTHLCEHCGHEWRPFPYATVGVEKLEDDPGDGGLAIPPGLYAHYKGPMYRVLFTARYVSAKVLTDDETMIVFVADDADGNRICTCPKSEYDWGRYRILFEAKNSSNVSSKNGDDVVVYVALYGDGRVSTRTAREFNERVEGQRTEYRGEIHDVPRFRKVDA